MTDLVDNLKRNFPAVLILGGVGLAAGLLINKKKAPKFGLIGAAIGAGIAAVGVRLPGATAVGFDPDCIPPHEYQALIAQGRQPHRPMCPEHHHMHGEHHHHEPHQHWRQ